MRQTRKPLPDLPPVSAEVLDQFAPDGPLSADDVEAAVRRFKKALIERALGGELTHHLGYPPGGAKTRRQRQSPQRDRSHNGPHR